MKSQKKILEKNFRFPNVIGETENDLIEIIDNVSLSNYEKKEGLKELRKKLRLKTL